MTFRIASIEPIRVPVSAKTAWTFLRLRTDDGIEGLGECTTDADEPLAVPLVRQLGEKLAGEDAGAVTRLTWSAERHRHGKLGEAVLSALEQALWDVQARRAGVPVTALFGGPMRPAVRYYANINRGTRDRTPAGWRRRAAEAKARGMTALKMAPFDDVRWTEAGARDQRRLIAHGVEVTAAVRDEIGPDMDLLVDCHWRFSEAETARLILELAPLRLFWLECPVTETATDLAAVRRLKDLAHAQGMRLAGGERLFGLNNFRPMIEEQAVDVVMPDVRFVGGFAEAVRLGFYAAGAGVEYSPHNPSGPVLDDISHALSTVVPSLLILEHQFAEDPLFDELVERCNPAIENGWRKAPTAPGWGVTLRDEVLRSVPGAIW